MSRGGLKPETIIRKQADRAELARDVTRLKRCGLTYRQIAEQLKCSVGQAHKLVHEGIEGFREEAKQEIAKWREDSLVELSQAKAEAWIEWHRSKQDRQRRTIKKKDKAAGKNSKKAALAGTNRNDRRPVR